VSGLVVVLAIIAGSLALRGPAPLPTAVNPLLPDLVMGPIDVVMGGLAEFTGARVVRVEATIVNKGAGDFLVAARRDFPWSDHWTVYQRIQEAGGGFTEHATAADLIFAGAPHSHWHVKDMEAHRLERIDTGEVLSEVIKQGFCPYDTDRYFADLPGSPANPVHVETDCEGPAWVTSLTMGVSVGWGDKYPWHMVEQSIDITNVPDGKYRIREIADPYNWFKESDETNNETWVDIEIVTKGGIPSVTVIDRAPPS
jgi:Lysyl oxidase